MSSAIVGATKEFTLADAAVVLELRLTDDEVVALEVSHALHVPSWFS